jgi:hypothetical protein
VSPVKYELGFYIPEDDIHILTVVITANLCLLKMNRGDDCIYVDTLQIAEHLLDQTFRTGVRNNTRRIDSSLGRKNPGTFR